MKRNRARPRRQRESRQPEADKIILLLTAALNFLAAVINLIRELIKR